MSAVTKTDTFTVNKEHSIANPSSGANAGSAGDDHAPIGNYGGWHWRELIRATLSFGSAPAGGWQFLDAELWVKTTSGIHVNRGGNPRISVCRLADPFTASGGSENSWGASNGTVWPGPDNEGSVYGMPAHADSSNVVVKMDVSDPFEPWCPSTMLQRGSTSAFCEGETNNGMRLMSFDEEDTSRTTEFHSIRGSYDPRFVVRWKEGVLPLAPTLSTPSGVQSSAPTTFTGAATESPVSKYDVQVSTDPAFGTTLWNGTALTSGISGTTCAATYAGSAQTLGVSLYWRMRTANDLGKYGAWSASNAYSIASAGGGVIVIPTVNGLATIANLAEESEWIDGLEVAKPELTWRFDDTGGRQATSVQVKLWSDVPALLFTDVFTGPFDANTDHVLETTRRILRNTFYRIEVIPYVGSEAQASSGTRRFRVQWGQAVYTCVPGATATGHRFDGPQPSGATARAAYLHRFAAHPVYGPWKSTIAAAGAIKSDWNILVRLSSRSAMPVLPQMQAYWSASTTAIPTDQWFATSCALGFDESFRRFGVKSLKVTTTASTVGYVYPKPDPAHIGVIVSPDTQYTFSAYVHSMGRTLNAPIYLSIYSEASVLLVEADLTDPEDPGHTVNTGTHREGWQRLHMTFRTPPGTQRIQPTFRVGGGAVEDLRIDAVQLEEGSYASPWTPGMLGPQVILDKGGFAVDASKGGSFRLKGGSAGARDLVELGGRGLAFGGSDVPVGVYSPSPYMLHVGAPVLGYRTLDSIATPPALAGALHADPVGTLYWKKADGTDAPVMADSDSGAPNMLVNGGFRDGTAYWNIAANTGVTIGLRNPADTYVLHDGDIPGWVSESTALRGSTMEFSRSSDTAAVEYSYIYQAVPVSGGEYYSASVLLGVTGFASTFFQMQFYDITGVNVGGIGGNPNAAGSAGGAAYSDWVFSSISGFLAPAAARKCLFILYAVTPASVNRIAWFDQAWMGPGKVVRRYTVLPPITGGSSSGAAGGVLSGTYPNPSFASDMATQAELNAHAATAHSGTSSPTGAAGGVLGGTYPNPTFSADMATQAELDAAVAARVSAEAAHASAGDPHTGYQKESEKDQNSGYVGLSAAQGTRTGAKFLRDDGTWQVVAGGGGSGGAPTGPAGGVLGGEYPNPVFANDMATQAELDAHSHTGTYEPAGGLTAHAAAADPHLGYQKESEKGAASGYASLDAGGLVPIAQHGTGAPDGTKFLRDDRTWVTPAAGGGGGVIDASYLVGTAHAGLSAEIVVGSSPGGELGGSWAAPTVDATHSGSSHYSVLTGAQAAAEATVALSGMAPNMLKNGGFRDGLACWSFAQLGDPNYSWGWNLYDYYILRDGDVPGWTPNGAQKGSVLYIARNTPTSATEYPRITQNVPAVAGQWYSGSGLIGNHRFGGFYIGGWWYDEYGTNIGAAVGSNQIGPINNGGPDYDDWGVVTFTVQAPPGTRYFTFFCLGYTPSVGAPDAPIVFIDQLWMGVGKTPYRFQATPASYQDGTVRVDGTGRAGVNTNPDASTLAVAPADGNIHLIHGGATGAGMWVDSYDYSKRWFVGGSGGHSGFRIYGQGIGDAFIVQADGNIALRGGGVLMSGAGVPEGVVVANRGAMYLRTDGGPSSTLYVKTSNSGSNIGWTAK